MNHFRYFFAFSVVCLVAGCNTPTFVESKSENQKDLSGWERKAALETPLRMHQIAWARNTVENWPPRERQTFPNIQLIDHEGNDFSMQSLAGKPVLIEFIAMSCAGCQAFAGGKKHGGFKKFAVQRGLDSMEDYFQRYTGYSMDTQKLNVVQVIVYDLKLSNPEPSELAAWREHFHLTSPNMHVVGGTKSLANGATKKMIPGFMLLDADLQVVSDSTGHRPKRDFYRDLLPQAKKMLDGPGRQQTITNDFSVRSKSSQSSKRPKRQGKEISNPFLTK
jgi:hypothetical protein